jgi:hypothetical protein
MNKTVLEKNYEDVDRLIADALPANRPSLPNLSSVNALFEDLNAALVKYQTSNPNVNSNLLYISMIRTMLTYPLDWMKKAGSSEHYIEVMTDHVKALYASSLISDNVEKK